MDVPYLPGEALGDPLRWHGLVKTEEAVGLHRKWRSGDNWSWSRQGFCLVSNDLRWCFGDESGVILCTLWPPASRYYAMQSAVEASAECFPTCKVSAVETRLILGRFAVHHFHCEHVATAA